MARKKQSKATYQNYDPAYCEQIVQMGKQGYSQKMMWSELGIGSQTAMQWMEEFPEFHDAADRALTASQGYWEQQMLLNTENKGFNARVAEVALKGQFPSYKPGAQQEIKAKVEAEIKVDFGAEVAKLLTQLKESETKK